MITNLGKNISYSDIEMLCTVHGAVHEDSTVIERVNQILLVDNNTSSVISNQCLRMVALL